MKWDVPDIMAVCIRLSIPVSFRLKKQSLAHVQVEPTMNVQPQTAAKLD